MTKKDLVKALADRVEMTIKDSETVVNATLRLIGEALRDGGKIQLTDFITMSVREREARPGRNPLTKEEIIIPAGRQISYKTGKGLKNFINGIASSLDDKAPATAPAKKAAPAKATPVKKAAPVAKAPVAKKPVAKK
jgi:DNA-binding protein HU-beta